METPFWCMILVHQYSHQKSTKTSGVHFFFYKLFLFTRKLAYVRINISSNTWNGYTCWKSGGETFFQRESIPILVSLTVKTRKLKLLYFRNETCYGNENVYKDLLFVYLQPNVNQNLQNLAILTLQFEDVTVKTIYTSVDSIAFYDKMKTNCMASSGANVFLRNW